MRATRQQRSAWQSSAATCPPTHPWHLPYASQATAASQQALQSTGRASPASCRCRCPTPVPQHSRPGTGPLDGGPEALGEGLVLQEGVVLGVMGCSWCWQAVCLGGARRQRCTKQQASAAHSCWSCSPAAARTLRQQQQRRLPLLLKQGRHSQ